MHRIAISEPGLTVGLLLVATLPMINRLGGAVVALTSTAGLELGLLSIAILLVSILLLVVAVVGDLEVALEVELDLYLERVSVGTKSRVVSRE